MTDENSTSDQSSLDELRSIAHRKTGANVAKASSKTSASTLNKPLDENSDSPPKRGGNRFRFVALIGVLAIGAFWFEILPERSGSEEQSAIENIQEGEVTLPPIAQSLESVAEGIKQYRSRNGFLPTSLTGLPEFPEDGIEWDLDQYNLILLDSRPEFFYTPNSLAGFIVIGRLSTDVWMYVERDIPPLTRVTALP